MATINQTPATWRGQVLRSGWDRAGNYTSRAFHQVFTFFSTYPPLAQGLYYLAIGLWPLVSIRSYQEVTGARADVWVPSGTHLTSYILIMAPLAWWLAIPRGLGVNGLVVAMILATLISCGLLLARFWQLSRRD